MKKAIGILAALAAVLVTAGACVCQKGGEKA